MSPVVSLALAALSLTACGSGSGTAPPSSSTTAPTSAITMPRARLTLACPPPKHSDDVCAAVMTYVKNPANGGCCAYASPCNVPITGQQYGDDKCTVPMGPPSR